MNGRASVALTLLMTAAASHAAEFAGVFGDGMVLQRDQPIAIRGQGTPGEDVTVMLAGSARTAQADASGTWRVVFPAMSAGGPHTLELRAAGQSPQVLSDVLIGDLWLCSGQSNMHFPVSRSSGNPDDALDARQAIRLFTVPQDSHPLPQAAFARAPTWRIAGAESIPDFSAVCFFFALEMRRTHPVPLGLIHSSWGGAQIEAWMSAESLELAGGFDEQLELLRSYASDAGQATALFGALWEEWWRRAVSATERPWEVDAEDALGWSAVPAMQDWKTFGDESLAGHDGMVWYRTTFVLDEVQAKQRAQLELGGIDEVDVTWINGELVGSQFGWGTGRTYEVPRGVLRAGENSVAVNVLSTWDSGGLLGPKEHVRLKFDGGDAHSLADGWQYRRVSPDYGLPPRAPWESIGGLTGLFNAMIAPLQGLRFAGALWYQGESNAGNPEPYAGLLAALIGDWRGRFGESFAFLIVQLPNFGTLPSSPSESGWAAIRDAQRRVARDDARSGLVVTIDVGDALDLHPPNKQVVGRRAADVARALKFGNEGLVDGVPPADAVWRDGEVMVAFDLRGASLVVAGDSRPAAFELCTDDSCAYAEARLEENRILLSAKDVRAATRVRHCWADAPICNLYSASGLPVGTFEVPIHRP